MKKGKVVALVVGLLWIGVHNYASAEDLFVTGNLQVGPTIEGNPASPSTVQINAVPGPSSNAFVVASVNGGAEGAIVIKPNFASGIASIQGADSHLTTTAGIAINPEGGNVGIGTATPSAKLQVNGSIGLGSGEAQSNKALCWASSGTIGYCTSRPEKDGTCTCNAIY